MAAQPQHHLVSIEKAADYYDTSTRTIRNYIAAGKITGYRLPGGRLLRVDIDELNTALRQIPSAASI